MVQWFPQGIATGKAFCNRLNERSMLKKNIEAHENIVLVAPRRYGKTSLVTQVLHESKIAGAHLDFFFVLSQEDVTKVISEGVSKIASELVSSAENKLIKIVNKLREYQPKLMFNVFGTKIEINSKQVSDKSISEMLLSLDHLAQETEKSCVLIFDEFQQIGQLTENHAVEAAIRHAVERSNHVSYIFCGSIRHLLNEMFSSKNRPLYHLCDLMEIYRISKDSYFQFLQNAAISEWGITLANDVIDEILELTEHHPYYVNALCRKVWCEDKAPTLSSIQRAWIDFTDKQSSWIAQDLSQLSLTRRKLLFALALNPTSEPLGQSFVQKTKLGTSTVQKSLDALMKLDLIYRDEKQQYRVLDPCVAYFIRENS
ncbi:ATP-binding protein [Thiotrichales bacterium 19S3-7]|nr:ATP-binding protein [Thiotrichales bacterium 19S3-7]MCF6803074.1 ATP-binding protein [Thiotrichales bacterium 19S3-11]